MLRSELLIDRSFIECEVDTSAAAAALDRICSWISLAFTGAANVGACTIEY
jgi:hypothetical protein